MPSGVYKRPLRLCSVEGCNEKNYCNGFCRNCYNKQYKQDNKKKIKQWKQDNKEKIAEYHKKYNQEHKEKILKYKKKYRIEHGEYYSEYRKEYNQVPTHKKNAKKWHRAYYKRTRKEYDARGKLYRFINKETIRENREKSPTKSVRLNKVRTPRTSQYYQSWSIKDTEYLIKNYPNKKNPIWKIAVDIGRTYYGVMRMAKKIGLYRIRIDDYRNFLTKI